MTRALLITLIATILLVGMVSAADYRQLPADVYMDKVKAGWLGQMVGVVYGARTEFKAQRAIYEEEIPAWSPERVAESLGQDDIYVEMSFLQALEKYGLDINWVQAGKAFADTGFQLWHANKQGRENVRAGIMPPDSGDKKNNPHYDDIDFQIEADVFGLLNPGMPQSSNMLGERFGRIMNYGDGLYGGMFTAAMYSNAFFENDVEKVVDLALRSIPLSSTYSACIRDVVRWHRKNPTDWRATWQLIEDKWVAHPTGQCSTGKFNIDARVNGAYVVMGLLYGDGDFEKTMEVSTRCGQDSDCNPSSAMGVLCTIKGYDAMPDEYKSGLPAMADQKFSYTPYTYEGSVAATAKIAREQIRRAGGSSKVVDGREIFLIPVQHPKAPKLEQ